MADSYPETRSRTAWWRAHPIAATFATIGVLAVLAGTSVILHRIGLIEFNLLQFFYESDEAPIRVRNGSVEIELFSSSQKWGQVGGSPNWRIPSTKRFKDEYTVWLVVTGEAKCGGSLSATGPDVVVTYSDGSKIRFQATGNHTFVKPDGVTLTAGTTPQKLVYAVTGHIRSIAVGSGGNPAEMCTFTHPSQLVNAYLFNFP